MVRAVGSKVTIRRWDDLVKQFPVGGCGGLPKCPGYFNEGMKKFCGRTLTIEALDSGWTEQRYRMSEDNRDWQWTEAMFEKQEIKTTRVAEATPIKKEKGEKDMAGITVLERMADSKLNKDMELAGAQGLPTGIMAALKEQMEEEAKNNAKAAAKQILDLINKHTTNVEEEVKELRRIRQQEKNTLARLEKLNRAKAYGIETSNFVPLAILLGEAYKHQLEDVKLAEIPEDWEPANTEKAAKEKAKAK